MGPGVPTDGQKRPFWRLLYFWVLIGILAGVTTGYFAPAFGASLQPLGEGFINLVKMIIPPVIFLTVVLGIVTSKPGGTFGASPPS